MNHNSTCPHCGNNPIPHLTNWYYESLNVVLTPVRRLVLHNPLSRLVSTVWQRIKLGERLLSGLLRSGVLKINTDKSKCKSPRAQVLWEEAERRGIKVSEITLLGRGIDSYIAEKQQPAFSKIYFSGLPRPSEGVDPWVLDTMDDKAIFKRKLLEAKLPMPAGGAAATWHTALKIFNSVQKPVIVKPRAGSRGRHSTTYVYTKEDLKKAFKIAKQLCFWVIVEEHLFGPVYRGTVIDYKTRGVLRGDSPQVTGDGLKTITELVTEKNAAPHPGVKDIKLDEKSDVFLARQRFTRDSILPAGHTVTLSEKIGVNYGGSSSEDYDICHPDTIKLFEDAARVVGDPIVGFDFIIGDINKSWKEQRCGFLEANSLPFINLHHDPLLGTPRNVAANVWELVGM